MSAIYQEYIYVYYIVFPVYYRLTLTQCQKHLLRYHIFSNTTGKHCIFAINEHKGKWDYIDDLKQHYFVYPVEYLWLNRLLHYIAIWP